MKKQIYLAGPAEEVLITWGVQILRFVKDKAVEVDAHLADELLARNPEGYTLEQAAGYGLNIWLEPKKSTGATGKGGEG